jgi:hypothetical protein
MNRRSFFSLLLAKVLPLAALPTAALSAPCFTVPELPGDEENAALFPRNLTPIFRLGMMLEFSNGARTRTLIYDGAGWVQLESLRGRTLVQQLRHEGFLVSLTESNGRQTWLLR